MTSQNSDTTKAVKAIILHPRGANLDEIKQAVLDAKLPFKVRPFWYEPGKHERVISLGEPISNIGPEYVVPKNHASRVKAVLWFFGFEDLPVIHTPLTDMRKVFGDGVQELDPALDTSSPFDGPVAGARSYDWP